jgi:Tfp pilus assembly protein PilV
MRSRTTSRQPRSPGTEDGFTIIEVLVAALVLVVGILGMVGAFDSARKLDLLSERRTSIAHRAQLEIERLQTVAYSKLALNAAPTHSAENTNPNYYVQTGGTEYQWEQSNGQSSTSSNTDKLVEEKIAGIFQPSVTTKACPTTPEEARSDPCTWTSTPLSGSVYYFVTADKDSVCVKAPCPIRLTVAVTVTVAAGSHAVAPALVSTVISP